MSLPAVTTYCTWAQVGARLSTGGASLRVDDDAAAAQADVLESAAVEVNGYCQLLYDPETLAQSNWINKKARAIAVYLACGRRANPVPKWVEKEYDKAIADLEKIQLGVFMVPDVPQKKANVPVLTNQRVKQTPVPHVVNVDGTSTGKPENYPAHPDNTDLIDYSL